MMHSHGTYLLQLSLSHSWVHEKYDNLLSAFEYTANNSKYVSVYYAYLGNGLYQIYYRDTYLYHKCFT